MKEAQFQSILTAIYLQVCLRACAPGHELCASAGFQNLSLPKPTTRARHELWLYVIVATLCLCRKL
jgi:hypothetical protein